MALGLFPLPDAATLAEVFGGLARVLREHDYSSASTLPFPGGARHIFYEPANFRRFVRGRSNAYEYSLLAPVYHRGFSRRNPAAFALYNLFSLERAVEARALEPLLGAELFERLIALGILERQGGSVLSRILATAYNSRIYFHDRCSINQWEKKEFVFLGRCSVRLAGQAAEEVLSRRFNRGLDLCTGSGVQALNLADWCDDVTGGDINRRALAYAAANAAANGVRNARFLYSDLFAGIEGRFDCITANTPFLLLDEGSEALDGYGGEYGMEVELRLLENLDAHLNDGGLGLIVASSAIVGNRNLLVEKLEDIFTGRGYRIDLYPINEYYSKEHYRLYESLNVQRCVLYIARLEKTGAELSLRAHNWAPWTQAAHRLKISHIRRSARRQHTSRQAS